MFSKEVILTQYAPQPIGPYSQAVMIKNAQNVLYISGQIPINPSSGKIVEGDVAQHTQQVMDNLSAILKEADMDFSHIVKTTIFLTDMDDFSLVNQVYSTAFSAHPPARETVAVKALPAGARIEISAVAIK